MNTEIWYCPNCKENTQNWRGCGKCGGNAIKQTFEMVLPSELADLRARVEAAESNLRFYDGLIMGDGDHDKIMLARDGAVFIKCFSLLGMDVSGVSTEDIPDAIERLKQQLAAALAAKGAG